MNISYYGTMLCIMNRHFFIDVCHYKCLVLYCYYFIDGFHETQHIYLHNFA